MALDLDKYEAEARLAIKAFWGSKDAATQSQIERGIQDVGERSAVTAGKHLNAFVALLSDIARGQGVDQLEFHTGRRVPTLPGFYRPTKEWDLIVTRKGTLVAVFELKSIGSSFGNNMNNRSEEAIGAAQDFWTAFREDAFGAGAPRPFLAWIMIMRECAQSTKPVKLSERFFPVASEFVGSSYSQRCDILCRKLIVENLYTATALMLTDDDAGKADGAFTHLSEAASFRRLAAAFAGHIVTIGASQ